MKKLTFLLVAVFLFTAFPLMAEDGRTLKRYCEIALLAEKNKISSAHLMEDFNICVSSVNTVFHTISKFEQFVNLEHPNAFSCVPADIELLEKIKVVYAYLKEHPDQMNTDGVSLIMVAIAEAFPCTESQPPK